MSFTGHIADVPAARRVNGSSIIAEDFLGLVDADLATLATAQAACDTAVEGLQICDVPIGNQCSRGFEVADAYGATFGSTFDAFQASLPDSTGHPRRTLDG